MNEFLQGVHDTLVILFRWSTWPPPSHFKVDPEQINKGLYLLSLEAMSTFFKNLFGSKSSSVIYVHTDKNRYFTGDMVRLFVGYEAIFAKVLSFF